MVRGAPDADHLGGSSMQSSSTVLSSICTGNGGERKWYICRGILCIGLGTGTGTVQVHVQVPGT
jgi:hypothetical protein